MYGMFESGDDAGDEIGAIRTFDYIIAGNNGEDRCLADVGLMRSQKERETRPPKPLEDACYGSACEQQWWKIQHDGAN